MPLYEYECEGDTPHRFELIQKFSDPPVDTCPTCGSKVHKLISSPAIQFKGSGWYITDYARKGSPDKASPPSGSGSSGSGTDTSSSSTPSSSSGTSSTDTKKD
jgi:putative FmdB family regulatory protein